MNHSLGDQAACRGDQEQDDEMEQGHGSSWEALIGRSQTWDDAQILLAGASRMLDTTISGFGGIINNRFALADPDAPASFRAFFIQTNDYSATGLVYARMAASDRGSASHHGRGLQPLREAGRRDPLGSLRGF